jgi:drug/metabolite transporter (DMT)-like permease
MSFAATTVTNSGFLVNTCAVMTPIAAWWILRKPPPAIVWPAAAAAILGVACMSGSAGVAASWGDAISLLSAMFYALWMVLLGEYVVMHGGVRWFSFVQFAAVGIVASLLGVIVEPISMDGLWRATPHLLFVGAVSTGFAYLLQAVAQRRTPACDCAIITSSEAIFGAIGGYLMFGERLGVGGFIGAAFILLAIIVVELAPRLQARFATIRPVEDEWQIADQ